MLFKYIDDGLSDRKAGIVKEHIRDCPDCAEEADYLGRTRSLLVAAGKMEMPDEYWDTYWSRLEKRLPDELPPRYAGKRTSSAVVAVLRQPAFLGRVAVYIFLLAFVIYMTPDHPIKPAQLPSKMAEMETYDATLGLQEGRERVDAGDGVALDNRWIRSRRGVDAARDEASTGRVEYAERKDKLEFGFLHTERRTEKTEEISTHTSPAKSVPEPKVSLGELQDGIQDVTDSEDEYVAADNYFRKGEYLQAIPAYQNFIKANVHDRRTLKATYQIGEAYYQLGNYSEALSNFVAVVDAEFEVRRDGQSTKAPEGLDAYGAASKAEAAKESDVKAKRPGTSRGAVALSRVAQESETLPKAREDLISRAIFRLAESYEHLGKLEEALTTYKKYVEGYPQGEYLPQAKEKIAQIAR